MFKKISILVALIVIGITVFLFYQESFAKPNVILQYIEETDYMIESFNQLYQGEAELMQGGDVNLRTYTTEVVVPGLIEIHTDSLAYGEEITNPKLRAIHDLHTEAIGYYLQAEEAWLIGEQFNVYFEKGDELYALYETKFASLAEKMNVELTWE